VQLRAVVSSACGQRSREKSGRIDGRSVGGDVEEHVVELGVIGDAEATTNDRLVLAKHRLPDAWCVGKADVRSPVIEVLRGVWYGARRQRQALIPECLIWIGLASHGKVVQQIDGLLGEFPADAEVQGQVLFDSPVILRVDPR